MFSNKIKKIPMRMCVVTREKYPKDELIRIVRTTENKIVIDRTGKLNGRGAYLKKDIEVFKKAQAKKILDKVLEIQVNDEVFDELNKI